MNNTPDQPFTMPPRRSPEAAARCVLESFVRALAGLEYAPGLAPNCVDDHVRQAAQITLLIAEAASTLASTCCAPADECICGTAGAACCAPTDRCLCARTLARDGRTEVSDG